MSAPPAIELYCEVMGAGPPLVICHGLFGSGTNWRTLAKALAAHYQVHLLDARNHGRSAHADSMSYGDMALDLIATLKQLGLSKVHLIGHSMGGKTAMVVALTAPHLVRSLVIADVSPVRYAHHFNAELTAMTSLALEHLKRRSQADAELGRFVQDCATRAFLLQNLVTSAATGRYHWRINLKAIEHGIAELTGFPAIAACYEGPATCIRGGQSNYVLDEHEALFRRYFADFEMRTIAQAGHWLHAQQPQAFLQVLKEHLTKSTCGGD
ncbi:MAG: alpha/beta fold hydrolase [Gammaproteobacteria bacterium]|nr:alpha/beta fold hydrolase [Gammaproteobacteria bacterium]